MKEHNKTPDHIKEIRQIRKKMSKEYWRNPSAYMAYMFEKQKEWAHAVGTKKKVA